MRYRPAFIAAVALGAFALIGGTGLTVSSGWLITMASQHPPVLVLSVAIVMVRFFGIFRSVARYGERVISHQAIFQTLTSMRESLFNSIAGKLQTLNIAKAGKTIVDDVERVQELALRTTLPGASAFISGIFTIAVAAWISPSLLLWVIPAVLLFAIVAPFAVRKYLDPLSREIEDEESALTEISAHSAYGALEAEVFGYLDIYKDEISQKSREIYRLERRFLLRSSLIQCLVILSLGLLLVASGLYFSGESDLIAVKVAMAIFLMLVGFEGYTTWFPNLYLSGKNIRARENLIALSNSVPETPHRQKLSEVSSISVEKLSPFWEERFLIPISFEIQRGETLLLTGPSGVGKSTIAAALFGLCTYGGSISINGVEVRNLDAIDKLITGTLQNGYIFNTSIRENLLISNTDASDEELNRILGLLELNYLHLDEVIGEFGRKISGGEAKRLSIARALLSKSPFVLFDEPLEHLDDLQAARIESAINDECKGRGVIVISHAQWRQYSKKVEVERE